MLLVHIVLVVVTEVMTSTTSQKALIASGGRVGSIAIQVRHARRRLVGKQKRRDKQKVNKAVVRAFISRLSSSSLDFQKPKRSTQILQP